MAKKKALDFNLDDLFDAFDIDSLDGYGGIFDDETETRVIKPRIAKPRKVAYRHAVDMANDIELTEGANYYALVSGDFIFGDLLEALIIDKETHIKRLDIATLSLSQDNIDSLRNIMDSGFCLKLRLIVSHYFYSHERNGLVPYLYQELDRGERFQFSVAGNHTKITCFETFEGLKFTIHGSANLRSSQNVEQFMLTQDTDMFDFNTKYLDTIHDQYYTINHGIDTGIAGRGKQWQAVAENIKEPTS